MNAQLECHALVYGQEFTKLPEDLFIPPDALEVLLDSFSGPLDLLLYLIRKQNIDIMDIPITTITKQYLHYIQLMSCQKLELAAEYLLMAAVLAEIKSRLLLPPVATHEAEQEQDPRMALVARLQAYEAMKQATELLDTLPRQERDSFAIQILPDRLELIKKHPELELTELLEAMQGLLKKEDHLKHHEITREILSVRERMSLILNHLQRQNRLEFSALFTIEEGRMGLVVSFLAILELARQSLLRIIQVQAFSMIHIQAV